MKLYHLPILCATGALMLFTTLVGLTALTVGLCNRRFP